jgi:hypothetical protein
MRRELPVRDGRIRMREAIGDFAAAHFEIL